MIQWRRSELHRQEAVTVERVTTVLQRWQGQCAICLAGSGVTARPHAWAECSDTEAVSRMARDRTAVKRITFASDSCCYRCYVPQQVCLRWQDKPGGRGMMPNPLHPECQFSTTLLLDVAIALWQFQFGADEEGWVRRQMGRSGCAPEVGEALTVAHLLRWWRGKVRLGGMEMTEMMHMVAMMG